MRRYGDKVPRTLVGMLIASLAILLGVAGVAVFVALVAAEMNTLRQESELGSHGSHGLGSYGMRKLRHESALGSVGGSASGGLEPLRAPETSSGAVRAAASCGASCGKTPRDGDAAAEARFERLDGRMRALEANMQTLLEENAKILGLLMSPMPDARAGISAVHSAVLSHESTTAHLSDAELVEQLRGFR